MSPLYTSVNMMKEDHLSCEQLGSYSDSTRISPASLCGLENDWTIRESKVKNNDMVPDRGSSPNQESTRPKTMMANPESTKPRSQSTLHILSTDDHYALSCGNEENELESMPRVAKIIKTFEAAIFREQTKADFLAKSPVVSHAEGEIPHTISKNELDQVSSCSTGMRQPVEMNASVPTYHPNELPSTINPSESPKEAAPIDLRVSAQAGDVWFREKELKSTGIAKTGRNLRRSKRILTRSVRPVAQAESTQSSAQESTRSPRMENKKQSPEWGRRKMKRKLLHEDKMVSSCWLR